MQTRIPTTIAILGGNTVAGLALSFLLEGAGYETIILKAALRRGLPGEADLLLVSPDLDHGQRKESLAALREDDGTLRVPLLTFSASVEENVFTEQAVGSSWPVEVGGLVRAIEAILGGNAEGGPTVAANPVGQAALT